MSKTLERLAEEISTAQSRVRPYGGAWYALGRARNEVTEAIGHLQEEERQAVRETLGAYGFNGPFTNRPDAWEAEKVAAMTPEERLEVTRAYLRGER